MSEIIALCENQPKSTVHVSVSRGKAIIDQRAVCINERASMTVECYEYCRSVVPSVLSSLVVLRKNPCTVEALSNI